MYNTALAHRVRVTRPTAGMSAIAGTDVSRMKEYIYTDFLLQSYFEMLSRIKMYYTEIIRMCCVLLSKYF